MSEKQHEDDPESGLALATAEPEVKEPPMFRVLLLNDDYTPMDFVVEVLMRFFNMPENLATQTMLQVHTRGAGNCGIFTRDIAETKVHQVTEHARSHQHPLMCTMEAV